MVEEEEGVGAFKQMMFLNCQSFFHLVLLANDNEKARVLLSKPVVSFVAKVGQMSTMQSNLSRKGPHGWLTRDWVLPEFSQVT